MEVDESRISNDVSRPQGIPVRVVQPGGRGEEQIMAVLKWGTHGGWHGHFDRTGLISMQRYGIDFYNSKASWFGYYHPMYKKWVQASVSHNMVMVDQLQQEAVKSDMLFFRAGEMMQASAVQTNARWCEVPDWPNQPTESGNMGVYFDPDFKPVLQRRLMVVTDDYIVIADYLNSSQEHAFDWTIHPVGFKGIEAAELNKTKNLERANADPNSGYYQITNCDWYDARSPILSRFRDRILNIDIRTLWPSKMTVMRGDFPVPSWEKAKTDENRRHTLMFRTEGKQARYLTIIEPYKDNAIIKNAEAFGPDSLRVELADGREQTVEIKNFEGDGNNIIVTITESKDGQTQRQEVLADDIPNGYDNSWQGGAQAPTYSWQGRL